jgi:hypothetical protein
MKRSTAFCAVALALFASSASASTVGLHVATAHFGSRSGQFETATPGLYLRSASGLTLGAYRNSDGDPSAYVAWTWETESRHFAVTSGAVVGYQSARIAPLLVASARVPITQRTAMRLALLPKPKGGAAGVHLAIEHDL